jgi:diguanylate cyclase (GGDEF)-like protein
MTIHGKPLPAHEMTDTAAHLDRPEAPAGAAPTEPPGARQWLTVVIAAAAVAGLLYLLSTHDALGDAWTTQVMLCVVALLAAVWGAIHRYHYWTLPLRELREQARRVQRGELSIESLTGLGGGAAELVPLIQELLREQRAAIAALEAEMKRKMASRTGALERTIENLKHQATRDGLTGLFNRRFLDTFLPRAVKRCQAAKTELCVLMMDVDHFKKLNDTLGHAAGDTLLKSIGQIIRSTARGEDVAFRFGGDEFVVLMLGSGEKAGKALAERLTSLVDGLCKTYHVTPRPRLSVGMVALASLAEPTVDALLVEADKRLYAVKAAHHAAHEKDRPAAPHPSTSAPAPPAASLAPAGITGPAETGRHT